MSAGIVASLLVAGVWLYLLVGVTAMAVLIDDIEVREGNGLVALFGWPAIVRIALARRRNRKVAARARKTPRLLRADASDRLTAIRAGAAARGRIARRCEQLRREEAS